MTRRARLASHTPAAAFVLDAIAAAAAAVWAAGAGPAVILVLAVLWTGHVIAIGALLHRGADYYAAGYGAALDDVKAAVTVAAFSGDVVEWPPPRRR